MFELIEHTSNPASILIRAKNLLKPGGILYLTTPNFLSLDRVILKNNWDVIHPEHILYFTPATLRKLIRGCTGLRIKNFSTRNISAAAINKLLSGFHNNIRKQKSITGELCYEKRNTYFNQKQALRYKMESMRLLRAVKVCINIILNIFKKGMTISVICIKDKKL